MASLAATASLTHPINPLIERDYYVSIGLPIEQLGNKSLQIKPVESKPYVNWSDKESSSVFNFLQKIVAVWNKNKIANQYLIFGKQRSGEKSFSWEAVPYYNPSNIISRFWQQFTILWRITFGGMTITDAKKQNQIDEYKQLFTGFSSSMHESAKKTDDIVRSNDAFCKSEVIEKQLVLAGRKINVLFNYAPIGFGGERLHFLIVPKEHKSKFSDLSEEEYLEVTKVSQKLIQHFTSTRTIEDVYLFHKTGVDAGQTIPHWHQHIILTSNKTQNFFGRLTVLKNMLIGGSSPMKGAELADRIQSLKAELKYLELKND